MLSAPCVELASLLVGRQSPRGSDSSLLSLRPCRLKTHRGPVYAFLDVSDRLVEAGLSETSGAAIRSKGDDEGDQTSAGTKEKSDYEKAVELLRVECNALLKLTRSHANVMQLLAVVPIGDRMALIVEDTDGSLAEDMAKKSRFQGVWYEPDEIDKFARQLIAGLAFLHSENTAHGAVQAENILVEFSGFNIRTLKFAGIGGRLSPQYCFDDKSEQICDSRKGMQLDRVFRMDTFALSCLVSELLAASRFSFSDTPSCQNLSGVVAQFDGDRDAVRLCRACMLNDGRQPAINATVIASEIGVCLNWDTLRARLPIPTKEMQVVDLDDLVEATARASNSTIDAACQHDLRPQFFQFPVHCSVCRQFVWGLTKAQQQGLQCYLCGVKLHSKCAGSLVLRSSLDNSVAEIRSITREPSTDLISNSRYLFEKPYISELWNQRRDGNSADSREQFVFGLQLEYGSLFTRVSFVRARQVFAELARSGHLLSLSLCEYYGWPILLSETIGRRCVSTACVRFQQVIQRSAVDSTAKLEQGCAHAMLAYANLLGQFEGLASYASDHLHAAARLGFLPAVVKLGDLMRKSDPFLSVRLYRVAAEAALPKAHYRLGLCYERGLLSPKLERVIGIDLAQALRHYRIAARAGLPAALAALGWFLVDGRCEGEKDTENGYRALLESAESGNLRGCRGVGILLLNGIGVVRNSVRANEWFRRAAESGDVKAMRLLGENLLHGVGCAADVQEAVKWFWLAAEASDPVSMRRLGELFISGQVSGSKSDIIGARRWWEAAAERGDSEAAKHLADIFRDGHEDVKSDSIECGRWLEVASTLGHTGAMSELGLRMLEGNGVMRSPTDAVIWLQRAAECGDAPACSKLAQCYAMGIGIKRDVTTAVRYWRKGAEEGDASAAVDLALHLFTQVKNPHVLHGAIREDPVIAEALKWLLSSAENGNVIAQRELGLRSNDRTWLTSAAQAGDAVACRALGLELERDGASPSSVFKLYRRAAKKGDAIGGRCLAFCYASGYGTSRRPIKAFHYWHQAALAGDAIAQVNTGWSLENGLGVSRDDNAAAYWYSKAAQAPDDIIGKRCYGRCLARGIGTGQDVKAARKFLKTAAKGGDAGSWRELAWLEAPNNSRSTDALQHAAKAGDLAAMNDLGVSLVSSDAAAGRVHIERAAQLGSVTALRNAGICSLRGIGGVVDTNLAKEYFNGAAKGGCSVSMRVLGILIILSSPKVRRVEDFQKAYSLFRLSAATGDTVAVRFLDWLGAERAVGDIVDPNSSHEMEKLARIVEEWFRQAAEGEVEIKNRFSEN